MASFKTSIFAAALLITIAVDYIQACGNVQQQQAPATTTPAGRKKRSVEEQSVEFVTSVDYVEDKSQNILDKINDIAAANNLEHVLTNENTELSNVNGKLVISYAHSAIDCVGISKMARLVETTMEEVKSANVQCH